jgi:hypothetical protein
MRHFSPISRTHALTHKNAQIFIQAIQDANLSVPFLPLSAES